MRACCMLFWQLGMIGRIIAGFVGNCGGQPLLGLYATCQRGQCNNAGASGFCRNWSSLTFAGKGKEFGSCIWWAGASTVIWKRIRLGSCHDFFSVSNLGSETQYLHEGLQKYYILEEYQSDE